MTGWRTGKVYGIQKEQTEAVGGEFNTKNAESQLLMGHSGRGAQQTDICIRKPGLEVVNS